MVFFFLLTCDRELTAPVADNPLDPENSETDGDPFNLTLAPVLEGVQLGWQPLTSLAPDNYLIYRKQADESEYALAATINHPSSMYIDTVDGENLKVNQSYWYYMLAEKNNQVADSSGIEKKSISLDFQIQEVSLNCRREAGILGIRINWTLSSIHTPDSLNIYRSDTSVDGEFTLRGKQSGISSDDGYFDVLDESEMGNTFYYYILAAFNGGITNVVEEDKKSVAIGFTIPGSYENIQAGIDSSIAGDSINVEVGTYTGNFDFSGKKITLKCQGDPGACILDGNGSGPLVTFTGAEDASTVLDGFTIQNGISTDEFDGGAMTIKSDPMIRNCTFNNNMADRGGAVFLREGAEPIFIGCNFTNNTSTSGVQSYGGGAIYSLSYTNPTFDNCDFNANQSEGNGGAVYFSELALPTMNNCTFSSNKSIDGHGGAMYVDKNHTMTPTNCSFNLNEAKNGGAGYIENSNNIEFKQCQFIDNKSVDGGSLYITGSELTIQNCILWDNEAYRGGAISNYNSTLQIDHSTVVENIAVGFHDSPGGGLYCPLGNWFSVVAITNSIFYGNIAEVQDQLDIASQLTASISYSNIENGGFEGTGNITGNPAFTDPDEGIFQLKDGSPCKNSGENDVDMGAYGGTFGDWGE